MVAHKRENPLFERFDDILEICRLHDVSISWTGRDPHGRRGAQAPPDARNDVSAVADAHERLEQNGLGRRGHAPGARVVGSGQGLGMT